MIQRCQRLFAQFKDNPPIELWRSTKDLRELNDMAVHNFSGNMSRDWKVFKLCPTPDNHAIGRRVRFDAVRDGTEDTADDLEVTDMREARVIVDDAEYHPTSPMAEARTHFA